MENVIKQGCCISFYIGKQIFVPIHPVIKRYNIMAVLFRL